MAILSNSMNAVSNDLFYLRIDNPLTPGSISFRHYDAAPLAPQNLSVLKSATNHPLLSWGKNKEPDIQYYKIYKYSYSELGWQLIGTTASTSFEDVSEIFLSPGNYVANEHWIYYKITAVDNYPHESAFSNQVGARVRGAALEKENNQLQVTDYSLSQNYPNPFNPTTSISYAVPAESHIQIKVYDLLGREVAELVNETKQTGYYSIEFNASGFSSGIFIYRITAINGERILFSESKRMLLIK
jgi:fibronectin type 3 domain-containing protein